MISKETSSILPAPALPAQLGPGRLRSPFADGVGKPRPQQPHKFSKLVSLV